MNRRLWFGTVPVAFVFGASGVLHFVRSDAYRRIVPPGFGDPATDVALSGACELVGAVAFLFPPLRRAASIGLVALLAAVWPANWFMALNADEFRSLASPGILWLRVPLQVPIALWTLWAGKA